MLNQQEVEMAIRGGRTQGPERPGRREDVFDHDPITLPRRCKVVLAKGLEPSRWKGSYPYRN